MKKSIIISISIVILTLGFCGVTVLYRAYFDRKVPNFDGGAELFIHPGTTPAEALEMLLCEGMVRNEKSLRRCFKPLNSIKPGHYSISSDCTSMYVSRMLSSGWQTPVNLVLSGTMRSDEVIAKKISSQMMTDSLAVLNALRDSQLLNSFGMEGKYLFAYIIPDTYQVYWTESAGEILSRLKKEYDAFWTEENVSKAKALKLSPIEASVLASIVSAETNHVPEMPSIAAVYLNRLRLSMKLQADPTVAYCFDYQLTRVLNKHLEVDSPFNTYKYAGLPPAPICVPSKSALTAVLNPDSNSFLYFCASPDFDGTHLFSASYSGHLRNARAFQTALSVRQRNAD